MKNPSNSRFLLISKANLKFRLSLVAIALALSAMAAENAQPVVQKVFLPPRLHLGNTGIISVQPIDEAAWIWHPEFGNPAAPSHADAFSGGWRQPVLLRFRQAFDATASPGFRTVRIAPQPGKLPKIVSRTPHPDGFIALDLAFEGERCRGNVELPPGITGVFVWYSKEKKLKSGANTIDLRP